MPIENRDLKGGEILVATYKSKEYECTVVRRPDGLRYRFADGSEFKSPSSAATAIFDAGRANGWLFWSLKGAEPVKRSVVRDNKPAKPKKAAKKPAKAAKVKKGTSPKAASKSAAQRSRQAAASRAYRARKKAKGS